MVSPQSLSRISNTSHSLALVYHTGDKLICMTNPSIVKPFVNADPKFADPPFEDSDWFEVDRRRVGDCVIPLVISNDNEGLAAIFLESLFAGTQYGLLSKYHTTLAYKLGIADPLTSEVSDLFSLMSKR
jgi:hypothetical protein